MATISFKDFKDGRILAVPTAARAEDFEMGPVFEAIADELKKNGEEYVPMIKGIFCIKIKKGNDVGVWVVDAKNGKGSVVFDPKGKGDVTISINEEDIPRILAGEINPQQAFFQGKLKLAGNIALALKLRDLQFKMPNFMAKL